MSRDGKKGEVKEKSEGEGKSRVVCVFVENVKADREVGCPRMCVCLGSRQWW